MRIGLATCFEKPGLTHGDQLLSMELVRRGHEVRPWIWNHPEKSGGKLDCLVLRSVWDYHLQHAAFLKWIGSVEESSTRLFNSARLVRWNLHKSYLLELAKEGHPVVPTQIISKASPISEVRREMGEGSWSEMVLKPAISATSFRTYKTHPNDPKLETIIAEIQTQSDLVVQPFLHSVAVDGEISLVFFRTDRTHFSHSVLKLPREGDFRVQAEFGGLEQTISAPARLVALGEALLAQLPFDWVYARVDLVDWKGQPKLSELEMIEPDLFLQHHVGAPSLMADAIENASA